MIKKGLILTALALNPIANAAAIPNNTTTIVEEEPARENEACSIVYVGSQASTDGRRYICRSGDATPRAMNMHMHIFEHNELANQKVYSNKGFEYTMPSETYRYISSPRNRSVNKGLNWEVSSMNEMGVCASATLTCGTNAKALANDPFVTTGLSEDNFAQIVGATAATARQGVEICAKIVDEKGSQDANAIMIMDKNEAWYMEFYTGHQYVAVKMPDDKMATVGNEFMLDKLSDFKDWITSKDYYKYATDNSIAQYDGDEKEENFLLTKTYGDVDKDFNYAFSDNCHMRTWIGQHEYLTGAKEKAYSKTEKYTAFFVPYRKLSPHDIIRLFRDRFETVLYNPNDPSYKYFDDHRDSLRPIAVTTAYQIHLLSIDPTLPKEIATEQITCFSNSSYSPFVPISNGVTELNPYYTHEAKYWGFDRDSAICVYKRLNALAETSREYYGKPVQAYIEEHEENWLKWYRQLLTQIKDLSLDKQKEVLTNYCYGIQTEALTLSNMLYEDLLWHIMNSAPNVKTFEPYISLEYYAKIFGWNYKVDGNWTTLTRDNGKTITINTDYLQQGLNPYILVEGDPLQHATKVEIKDDIVYLNWLDAQKYIKQNYDIVEANYKDYLSPEKKSINVLAIVLPLAIGIPLIAIAVFVPLYFNSKKKKAKQPETTPVM